MWTLEFASRRVQKELEDWRQQGPDVFRQIQEVLAKIKENPTWPGIRDFKKLAPNEYRVRIQRCRILYHTVEAGSGETGKVVIDGFPKRQEDTYRRFRRRVGG